MWTKDPDQGGPKETGSGSVPMLRTLSGDIRTMLKEHFALYLGQCVKFVVHKKVYIVFAPFYVLWAKSFFKRRFFIFFKIRNLGKEIK